MNKTTLLLFGLCLNLQFLFAQIPEWKYLSSPDGGLVANFALEGEVLFALTPRGIYRSEDEGYHWRLLPHSLNTTRNKYQLAVDGGVFYALEGGKLFSSNDEGASWESLFPPQNSSISPANYTQQFLTLGDTLLIAHNAAIYRSTDSGKTWEVSADIDFWAVYFLFEFQNEFFLVQDRFIYRSSDRGATWVKVFTNANGYTSVVALDSFVVAFYKNQDRLIRSRDGLRTWEVVDTDTIKSHISKDYGYNWVVADGQVMYYIQRFNDWNTCALPFCYSLDAGKTWHRGNKGKQLGFGRVLNDGIIIDKHLILSMDNLHHSLDSANTFFVQEAGLNAAEITQLSVAENSMLAIANRSKAHVSTNQGRNWTSFQTLSPFNWPRCKGPILLQRTQQRLFENVEYGWGTTYVSYSEDEGQTWNQITPSYAFRGSATSNDAYYYLQRKWGSGGTVFLLWKLSDDSSQFTEVPLIGAPVLIGEEAQLARMGKWLDIYFGQTHLFFDEDGQFVQQVEFPDCGFTFSAIYYQAIVNEIILVFCEDRAYVRPLGAADWQEIYPQDWTTGIPLRHHNPQFIAHHEGIIWVGLEGKGLYYSTDNTGRFYPVQPQMPVPYPTSIDFDETHIWLGTNGAGIWTFPLPKPYLDKRQGLNIKVFPNPSMGQLNLQSDRFILSEIEFGLMDAAGRQLENRTLPPGQYWNLDFQGLPKGLYFVQFRTDNEVFGLKWVRGN